MPTETKITPPDPAATMPVGGAELGNRIGYRAAATDHDDLIHARLGAGSSLFTALRCKHAPAAAHSLRVALSCSAWGIAVDLDAELLGHLEVAALLHDIGKIGVPDALLLKPGKLTESEAELVRGHCAMGLEIVKSFGAPEGVLEILRLATVWYSQSGASHVEPLPIGARMLAIADAFDSMTNRQVYRSAMSRNEALKVLVDSAGTQFDPELIKVFIEIEEEESIELQSTVARRWLRQLVPDQHTAPQQHSAPGFPAAAESLAPLFLEKLIGSMRDGVVFVDHDLGIQLWNRGAEILTGIQADHARRQMWRPSMLKLADERSFLIGDEACPVYEVIQSSVQSIRRVQIEDQDRRVKTIDMHIVPVVSEDGATRGANILMRDVSSVTTLEERCATLHEKATRDPLTQIANRAEFDRQHQLFIDQHNECGEPCSLIICDIDHFKNVNDTYGHPAGDAALKVFARLLSDNCRPGDLVARYGGEEFVLLCVDCDQAAGTQRAELIRGELENLALDPLDGKAITASFGVTQSAPNDNDEEMLQRADQALLEAKSGGRNRVVTIRPDGVGREAKQDVGWFNWWKPALSTPVAKSVLVSEVPLRVAVEKLRGYAIEYQAQAKPIDKNHVVLQVAPQHVSRQRRESDRSVSFLVELELSECVTVGGSQPGQVRTRVGVTVRPRRNRDRRHADIV
ncbi:MAG: diguanylate cyclase, partial [Pirellulales bacterium]